MTKHFIIPGPFCCCGSLCFVSLPHDAVGWSAVIDCGFPGHSNWLSPVF